MVAVGRAELRSVSTVVRLSSLACTSARHAVVVMVSIPMYTAAVGVRVSRFETGSLRHP
jgi:hypothetical protein